MLAIVNHVYMHFSLHYIAGNTNGRSVVPLV